MRHAVCNALGSSGSLDDGSLCRGRALFDVVPFFVGPLSGGLDRALGQSAIRGAAPDFALPTVQGGTMALSTLRGKSALLAFVTAECPYCQKLKKKLEAFALDADHQLVFICTGEEGARKIRETYSFTYPVLIDSAGAVSQAYKTPGVLAVYQIDTAGKVVDLVVGWPPAWEFVRGFGRSQPSEGS